jgi:hypothetical protein
MSLVVGPILARSGGYAFDTRSVNGVSRGYVYRRIEDAHYARRVEIGRAMAERSQHTASQPLDDLCVCATLDQFTTELVERDGCTADNILHELSLSRMA